MAGSDVTPLMFDSQPSRRHPVSWPSLRRWIHWAWFAAATFLLASSSWARTEPEKDVPPELRPWIPWVLSELGSDRCAQVLGDRSCQWPGVLELRLDEAGGKFRLFVDVDARGLRRIVGGGGAWPLDVEVDEKTRPVLEKEGVPIVLLEPGRHEITGQFEWSALPETLDVGGDIAFIDLAVGGTDVPLVKREQNKIWLKGLGSAAASDAQREHVELSVFRRIRDGVPLQVETLLVFQVAGKPRELSLPAPLLPGSVPLSVRADLAIALEPTGALRVQLEPGKHEVSLVARRTAMDAPFENRERAAPWPEREIWTFDPDPELRSVELAGLSGIDASRTELPAAWRADGAYVAIPGSVLTLTTTRRGQELVPENRLELRREFWLDESAGGFTVQDHLEGEMHQGWRLDLLSGDLGSVSVGDQSQVVTEYEAKRGVEIRDARLQLTAVSRVPRSRELSAVGWSEDVDQLSATLHLPPGWDVFSAHGVDEASRTWLSRWDLFNVFYALLVTLALLRLVGWQGGVIAAVALVLCRGESGAPEWVWLPLIGLAVLVRVLPAGRLAKVLRVAFYGLGVVALVMLVGFAVDQVRGALYPHLEADSTSSDGSWMPQARREKATAGPEAAEAQDQERKADELERRIEELHEEAAPVSGAAPDAEPAPDSAERQQELSQLESQLQELEKAQPAAPRSAPPKRSAPSRSLAGKRSLGSAFGLDYRQNQFNPDAIVQTGPGIPEIAGRTVQLSWSGPVVRDHEMSLVLISPWMNRLLTVLRLLALGALAWVVVRFAQRGEVRLPKLSSAAVAFGVFAALLMVPRSARADEPSDARLQELKRRLTPAAECEPHCVSVSSFRLVLDERLEMTSEVHVGALSAYRLPGPVDAFTNPRLTVDGKGATAVRLEGDGAWYVRLEPGVHEVQLRVRPKGDRITLDIGTPPKRIDVQAEGWSVSGVDDQGQAAGGTLTLQREAALAESDSPTDKEDVKGTQVAVPPFFRVERTLLLGVKGSVVTEITRLSEASSPEVVRLPLLQGERVTTPGIEVEAGVAEVSFPREVTTQAIESTLVLPPGGKPLELALSAPPVAQGSEVWTLRCGVVSRCTTEGVVPSAHIEAGHAEWTFRPWPGETLKIHAVQPAAATGSSLTVEKATLTLTPGVRTGHGHLEMAIRTSRSVVHSVTIPSEAKLESVTVDGRPQAVKAAQGKVRISLAPGQRRVVVEWDDPRGISAWYRSPEVSAGAAGVNFHTVVELPRERWLLYTQGPARGPALLFWGYLVLIVIAALLLPRLPFSPLGWPAWLLLGLGLTQVPVAVAVFIAGWFFAVGSRRAWPFFGRHRQNLLQLVLLFYSFAFILALFASVYDGLVSSPDMEIQGAGSHVGHLVWYADRSSGELPQVAAFSANLWFWRAFMLLWALWLSRALLGWLRWAWGELNHDYFWAPRNESPPATPPPAV